MQIETEMRQRHGTMSPVSFSLISSSLNKNPIRCFRLLTRRKRTENLIWLFSSARNTWNKFWSARDTKEVTAQNVNCIFHKCHFSGSEIATSSYLWFICVPLKEDVICVTFQRSQSNHPCSCNSTNKWFWQIMCSLHCSFMIFALSYSLNWRIFMISL